MNTKQPSEFNSRSFRSCSIRIGSSWFIKEEAVLGLLSQAAVQANPGAMVHAAVLHQKFHSDFVET